ncbi:MAG: SMI1/KNR4 family protein [Anaerolineae bacterium]|nr:SMI1/KNR4 family protein [Anaerolineae bacterium]
MNRKLAKMTKSLDFNAGTQIETISAASEQLMIDFPDDYVEFMISKNGGEGFVGESYLVLWKAEDLQSLNEAYEMREFFPGLVAFGSDGGGDGYAFQKTNGQTAIVQFPFIGLQSDITYLAKNFTSFIETLIA